MKTNDILLYGGLGLGLYLILKHKQQPVTPVVTSPAIQPGINQTLNIPASGASNLIASLTNAVKNILPSAGTSQSFVAPSQPVLTASGTTAVDTPVETINTPVVLTPDTNYIYVNTNDSLYKMFQNGDYPGAALSGFIKEEMFA